MCEGFARVCKGRWGYMGLGRVGEVNERVREQGTSSQARASCHMMAETHQAISIMYVIMSSRYVMSTPTWPQGHHQVHGLHHQTDQDPKASSSHLQQGRHHQVISSKAPLAASSCRLHITVVVIKVKSSSWLASMTIYNLGV